MNNVNTYSNSGLRDDREINGLFCEEVLREWLQNLEQLVAERDLANNTGPMGRSNDHAHLSLVQNSGRGT
ncbi:MAG: hypothetical protein ACXIUM_05210 [Wenzhouxiangella sp.]